MQSYRIHKSNYINLCYIINQIGSGRQQGIKFFNDNFEEIRKRLIKDHSFNNSDEYRSLFNQINNQNIQNIKDNIKDNIKEEIINIFLKGDDQSGAYLEWIIKSYLNGGIRLIEDLGRTKVALDDYRSLIANKINFDNQKKNIDYFGGIAGYTDNKGKDKQGLEEFLREADIQTALDEIKLKQNKRKKIGKEHKKIKEEGEQDYTEEYEDENLIIISPTTEKGSCYYGRNTQWCTASTQSNNMFNAYNQIGKLYIITPKNPSYVNEKYQFHFEISQFMNEKDQEININKFMEKYGTDEFKKWFCPQTKEIHYADCINYLPDDFEDLTFGEQFNQSLNGVTFPANLKSLTFGSYFNQPINGVTFPANLKSLTFGKYFNNEGNPLNGYIFPSNLQSLTFGTDFNQSLNGDIFPTNLQSLTFGTEFNNGGKSFNDIIFPPNLQSLTLGNSFFNSSLFSDDLPLNEVIFPHNLQSLTFGNNFNQPLNGVSFPANLKSLTFGSDFNQPLNGVSFPANLKSLTFGSDFNNGNQPLNDVIFPDTLQSLTFGENFHQPLDGMNFLKNIRSVCLSGKYFYPKNV
jgi:hypothetical protein